MNSAWFSYVTIFLLQLKIIWGAWLFRDLSSGDTSSYFVLAYEWYRSWRVSIVWSPLYTSLYGTLLHLFTDAYLVTITHRLIIVLGLALLVLALMRCLLPPRLAWLMAAWWVVLPIDFNALYEVHLFAVMPVIVAFLAISWKPGPWGRGLGLAALLASTVLVRNELLLATTAFAALALGWELVQRRNYAPRSVSLPQAYGIPLLSASLLIIFFWARESDRGSIRQKMHTKHTLNICQVYAFGYQQRRSDWTESPWTECQQLMARVYGKPEPSLIEALRSNPRAMVEHFWWNIQLIPNGIQVLLFNGTSGNVSPDYIAVDTGSSIALLGSLIICAIVGAGVFLLHRERRYWWKAWLRERIWAWLAMACVAAVVAVVIVTQRPRPSYMFVLGIMLRAGVGMCVFVVVSRFKSARSAAPVFPIVTVLLILIVPRYYYRTNSGRPLLDSYRRLTPYHEILEQPNVGMVAARWSGELCNYVGKSRACRPFWFRDLRNEVSPNTPLNQVLDKHRATLFFADDEVMSDALGRQFVANAASYGWKTVAGRSELSGNWAVLERASSATSASGPLIAAAPRQPATRDIVEQTAGIALGKGWYDFEHYAGEDFRWVNNDAELQLYRPQSGIVSLELTVEAGPGLGGQPTGIQVHIGDKLLQTAPLSGRQILKVNLGSGETHLRLHVDSPNKLAPGDPRILNFRVFRISVR